MANQCPMPLDALRLYVEAERELRRLAALIALRDAVDASTGLSVTAAKSEGSSWSDIGQALGVKRQTAWERWSHTLYGYGRRTSEPYTPEDAGALKALLSTPHAQLAMSFLQVTKARKPLIRLKALAAARHAVEAAIAAHVIAARLDGASWAQIGRVLGVSAQAACKRWAGQTDLGPALAEAG